MKKNLLFTILLYSLSGTTQAQFCDSKSGSCYQEDPCYSDSQINYQKYKYATVHNIYKATGVSVDLYMTVYSPCTLPVKIDNGVTSLNCRSCKRPFILLIHGGGFRIGCRTGVSQDCKEFAKRGYVAATIDYRLGWVRGDEKALCNNFCSTGSCTDVQPDSCKTIYKDSQYFAVYRALQDASAAMRFIAHYADNLNIDKNHLYLGGYSAGAVMAANLCYLNQSELNLAIQGAYSILGPLNSYGNSFTEAYKIEGLFNNWGSIADTSYIGGAEDKIPMIAFHGMDDMTIPFGKGSPLGCNGTYGYLCGSGAIYKKLVNSYSGLPLELYCCYGGHGIFYDGLSADSKSLYRIQKAVCFFNRLRNGDKTHAYVEINQQDSVITYRELDSISPVLCGHGAVAASAPSKNYGDEGHANATTGFTVYPNPAYSSATLQVTGDLKKIDISIADINGKILWSKKNVLSTTTRLPIEHIFSGLYFIIVNSEEYSEVIKLIKER